MPDHAIGRRPWDLLVVGTGTAGLIGAQTAASLGARVLLVERARFGGDCLWTGCVQSKAPLASGHAAAGARAAERYGVHAGGISVDAAAVLAHVRRAIAAIEPVGSPDAVRRPGARVTAGSVRSTGPAAPRIDGRPVRFHQALLATGSAPVRPDLPGSADAAPLTTDTFWDRTDLPERMAVLGGGTSGCELAQAVARPGARVTVVEAGERMVGAEDPDASAAVTEALVRDGVQVRTSTTAARVDSGRLVLQDGDAVDFDRLLVATGRRPGTAGLGLDAAGVDVDERGAVVVDAVLGLRRHRVHRLRGRQPQPVRAHGGRRGQHGGVVDLLLLHRAGRRLHRR